MSMTQPDESQQYSPIPRPSTIPRSASYSPGDPTIGIPTLEQLRGGGGESWYSRWPWNSRNASPAASSSSCPSPVIIDRDLLDPEETHIHSQSLKNSPSVLARVKERWRRVCRRSSLDLNTTPSWGVSLDDLDDHFYEDETSQSITEY